VSKDGSEPGEGSNTDEKGESKDEGGSKGLEVPQVMRNQTSDKVFASSCIHLVPCRSALVIPHKPARGHRKEGGSKQRVAWHERGFQ